MRTRTFAEVFDHLANVLRSERFLLMRGLNNDLPFYICEYPPRTVGRNADASGSPPPPAGERKN